ncbi:MAG: tetratricopeptide repeat protein [Burkholderiales bacterium]|jgi:tetratricopeptide (TPR) repeat protein|nr:tetratricopeptide repeat protein [Burkholderiales bacterium]
MFDWLKRKPQKAPAPPAPAIRAADDATLSAIAALAAAGDHTGAAARAQAALAERPDAAALHDVLGRSLAALGRTAEARAALERATDLDPERVSTHVALARIARVEHDVEAARDHLELAAHYAPDDPEVLLELGRAAAAQGDLARARRVFEQASAAQPGAPGPEMELAYVCEREGRKAEMLEHAERAIAAMPESIEAADVMRRALFAVDRWEEALPYAESVVARTPASAVGPRLNLGNVYLHTGRFDAAGEMYTRVLEREPSSFEARWNRAHVLLASARFREGWRDYAYRFASLAILRRPWPFPEWKGEPLEGKTLLVYAEQGLGDEIMFASCLPEMIARAKHCVVECDRRLVAVFRRSFPEVTVLTRPDDDDAIPPTKALPPIDFQVAAGTLPSHLRNEWPDFPRHSGYLRADPDKVAGYRARLGALGTGPKIGLSWRGGTQLTRTSARSLPLADLLGAFARPGRRFVSLQYGKVDEELAAARASGNEVVHWPETIADYDETAALVSALDIVISVQTALIHLTGALGRPVWILVPAVPEWRYLREGERMPWYPSARIFRQSRLHEWSGVLDDIARALDTPGTDASPYAN